LLAGKIRYAASLKLNQGVINTAAPLLVSLSATHNPQAFASIATALFEKKPVANKGPARSLYRFMNNPA
jgi:hypothetical protein